MTQDKTLREQFLDKFQGLEYMAKDEEIADFYEDKIKSVVREMRKEVTKPHYSEVRGNQEEYKLDREKMLGEIGYNQFGDDLLERLGIK
jgi:Tfp pilus assembly protein PilP